MHHDVTYAEITASLKRLLRRRRITYRQLGEQIGLSESGVKKLLTGSDASVGRLIDVCQVLGVHLDDVLRDAREGPREPFVFTEAQQAALAEQPELYELLWALTELHFDVDALCRRTGLAEATARRHVARLERLDLLRTRPDGTLQGTWPPGSPWHLGSGLGEAVMARLQRRFLEHAQRTFAEGPRELFDLQLGRMVMSRRTAKSLKQALRDTVAEHARQADREAPFLAESDRVHLGALTVMAPATVLDLVAIS